MPERRTPHRYAWAGVDRSGRRCSGCIDAPALDLAYAELRAQGVSLLWLRRSRRPAPGLDADARALLYRQLAMLLEAGLPLLQALDCADAPCSDALARRLRGGDTLEQAMRSQPRNFPPWDCALVGAAELGAQLGAGLQRLAEQIEGEQALRAKVKAALRYPLTVLAVAAAVFAFVMIAVVPTFASLARQANAELPAPTRALLQLSALLREPTRLLAALPPLLALVAATPALLRRLPPLRAWRQQRALGAWCRLLGAMLGAGMPLLDALAVLANATALDPLSGLSARLRARVTAGTTLAAAMRAEPMLPDLLLQLIGIGEQAGRLETMLERAAGLLEQQLEQRLQALRAWIEPTLLLALGAVCAALVFMLYGPLLQFGQVLG